MGRYVYDASLVKQTIEELNNALKKLDSVSSNMKAGINTIRSANGSQYIEFDESKLLALQEEAEAAIETDIKTIQGKATMIEEYEAAPWYNKLFASAGMALTKFGEGIASTVEDLGDGVVSVVGFVGGIFNSEFKNSVAEYVEKDHVGDWFNKQYESGALASINKYSWFSKDSGAANLFKGFGSVAPYIALSMTGVGTTLEVGMAVTSGIGSGTEAGLQQARMEANMNGVEMRAGDAFNSAFANGVWQGVKNGAFVYGMNKLTKMIQTRANTPRLAEKVGEGAAKSADDALTTTEKIFKKASKFKNTKAGQAIDKVDDVLKHNKVTNKVAEKVTGATSKIKGSSAVKSVTKGTSKVTSKLANSKIVSKIANSKPANLVTKGGNLLKNTAKATKTVATKFVTNHPGTVYTATAAAFSVDQLDEQMIGSQSRLVPEPKPAIDIGPVIPRPGPEPSAPTTQVVPPSDNNTGGTTGGGTTGGGNTGGGYTGGGYTGGGYNPGTNSNPGTSSTNKVEVNTPITDSTSNIKDQIKDVIGDKVEDITSTITNPGNTNPNNNTQYNPNINVPGNTNSSTGGSYYPGGSSSSNSGGGGYTDSGFNSENIENTENVELPGGETISGSFSEIIGGNKNTNIPTSSTPITTTTTPSQSKSIIPTIAGLGAAAAAGLGTKAYLDRKEKGENEESDFEAEEWDEEDSLNIEYNEEMETERDYLDPTDEYAYTDEPEESYEAVNSSELASMQ